MVLRPAGFRLGSRLFETAEPLSSEDLAGGLNP
jgi:hypothetical protein